MCSLLRARVKFFSLRIHINVVSSFHYVGKEVLFYGLIAFSSRRSAHASLESASARQMVDQNREPPRAFNQRRGLLGNSRRTRSLVLQESQACS